MEPSPLTQQARPEVFQQKVVELYEALFKVRHKFPLQHFGLGTYFSATG
jgi:hypothetical protein